MKRIYTILITTLILSQLLSCNHADKKNTEPFCVTYQVTVHSSQPHKLSITYKDSTELVDFCSTDKEWSKKVCLSSGKMAYLFVENIFDPENGFYCNEGKEGHSNQTGQPHEPITIRIIHEKKEIHSTQNYFGVLSLRLSDIDKPDSTLTTY